MFLGAMGFGVLVLFAIWFLAALITTGPSTAGYVPLPTGKMIPPPPMPRCKPAKTDWKDCD